MAWKTCPPTFKRTSRPEALPEPVMVCGRGRRLAATVRMKRQRECRLGGRGMPCGPLHRAIGNAAESLTSGKGGSGPGRAQGVSH